MSDPVIGVQVTDEVDAAEMDFIQDAIEEALGDDYTVMMYSEAIELKDAEEIVRELEEVLASVSVEVRTHTDGNK